MFLRTKNRFKDGKAHRYWSVVENQRTARNRVVQRQVLYLGEINDSQHAPWCKAIEVFQDGEDKSRQMARFPSDRVAPEMACEVVQVGSIMQYAVEKGELSGLKLLPEEKLILQISLPLHSSQQDLQESCLCQ